MTDDDKDARPLTDVGVMGHFLAWTPDGGHVVFRSSAGKSPVLRVPRGGGEAEPVGEVAGGAHISLSPDGSRIMDVVAHKVLWVSTARRRPSGAGLRVRGRRRPHRLSRLVARTAASSCSTGSALRAATSG